MEWLRSIRGLFLQVKFHIHLVYRSIHPSIGNDPVVWKNGAKPIKLLLRLVSQVGSTNDVLDGGPDSYTGRNKFGGKMAQRNVMYKENVALVEQKWLNQSSYRLK